MNKFDQARNNKKQNFTRVNFQIRVPTVRVVKDGEQLGIMPTDKARRIAQDAGLDLVEIAPHAQPPVCHIIDFNKYRYQQKQKEKEQRRKQKESATELKELRLRPGIQDHDIETKVSAARRFIEDGHKVQFNLQYKNREITHKEEGFKVINKIIEAMKDVASVERLPKMEGFRLTCKLEPKKNV
jgi:translation initiation factor IF-3